MLLVKLITLRNQLITICLLLLSSTVLLAQDNSPYSRYGIGDLSPATNVYNRAMAGISAAIADQTYINFNNPASYGSFFSKQEAKSRKTEFGRVLLDIGLNFDNRTLRETGNPIKFTSPNAYFSYLQLGLPVKNNLGIVFGLRSISKVIYNIERFERLKDPMTGLPIDSAQTRFQGDGGTFLFNTGAGFAIKDFSIGLNVGYLFGKKEYSTQRTFINDTVGYQRSNHRTLTTFGDLFFNGGIQYKKELNKNSKSELRLGIFGNLKYDINARRDIIRETIVGSVGVGDFTQDSVQSISNEKGSFTYPSNFGAGAVFQRPNNDKQSGFLLGIDYIMNGWDDYRFYGQVDSVKNNWQLKIGGEIKPAIKEAKYKNYMAYRAGVFFGQDYIHVGNKIPEFGITAGISLPIIGLKDPQRRFRTQYTVVNISAEYIKRGNKDNFLREDLFRLSVGFSLSDLWFSKRKYD